MTVSEQSSLSLTTYATAPARAQTGARPSASCPARPASQSTRVTCVRSRFMREAFNSSRERLWQENAAFAATVSAGALVLDAGAGTLTLQVALCARPLRVGRLRAGQQVLCAPDFYVRLSAIPSKTVASTPSLQPGDGAPAEPRAVLDELHRALRPGGRLIFSAPLFYESTRSRTTSTDTRNSASRTCSHRRVEIERLDWLEGYFATLGYQWAPLRGAAQEAPRLRWWIVGLIAATGVVLRRARGTERRHPSLEMRHKLTTAGYPRTTSHRAKAAVLPRIVTFLL